MARKPTGSKRGHRPGSAGRSAKPKAKIPMKGDKPAKGADIVTLTPVKNQTAVFDRHWPGLKRAYDAMQDAKDALTEARGAFGALIKSARADHLPVDEIKYVLSIKHLSPQEIARKWSAINWVAAASKIPVGGQLGLFPDGETVTTKGENRTLKEIAEQALADGQAAGHSGKNLADNPHPEGSRAARQWAKGYGEAQKALAGSLNPEVAQQAAGDGFTEGVSANP